MKNVFWYPFKVNHDCVYITSVVWIIYFIRKVCYMSQYKDNVRELSVIEDEVNLKTLSNVISSLKLVYPLKGNVCCTQLIAIKICSVFS